MGLFWPGPTFRLRLGLPYLSPFNGLLVGTTTSYHSDQNLSLDSSCRDTGDVSDMFVGNIHFFCSVWDLFILFMYLSIKYLLLITGCILLLNIFFNFDDTPSQRVDCLTVFTFSNNYGSRPLLEPFVPKVYVVINLPFNVEKTPSFKLL